MGEKGTWRGWNMVKKVEVNEICEISVQKKANAQENSPKKERNRSRTRKLTLRNGAKLSQKSHETFNRGERA